MADAQISFGPKLGLLNNAAIGEQYYDQLRPFLRGMDALVQMNVTNAAQTPPDNPQNGDAYIILSPTGPWVGKDNQIAVYSTQITDAGGNTLDPGWDYYVTQPGWIVFITSIGAYYAFNGTTWAPFPTLPSELWTSSGSGTTADPQVALLELAGTVGLGYNEAGVCRIMGANMFALPYFFIDGHANPNVQLAPNVGAPNVLVSALGGDTVNITLPSLTNPPVYSYGTCYQYTIKNATGAAFTINVLPQSGETIDGAASVQITSAFGYVTLIGMYDTYNPVISKNWGIIGKSL